MRVAIVGGGIIGLSIALRLRDAGADPIVLERSIPGAEASSAAAGMLAPQMEATGPGPFLELCLASRALYADYARELRDRAGMEVGYLPCGTLSVAFDDATMVAQSHTLRWQRERDLRVEALTAAQLAELEPALARDALGALLFPDDHQVDNRLLVRALSQAATRAQVGFRSGYVRGLVLDGECIRGVDLDGRLLEADAVVVAAGSWTGLVPGLPVSPQLVRPAKGQMVQLQLRAPLLTHVVYADHGYVVPRADGRVICGSTVELVGFDKQVTAEGLSQVLARTLRVCPALGQAAMGEAWAGLRPYTDDQLPILGSTGVKNLFIASGHFRNGILLTPLTGRLMADLVLGKRTEVDLSPFQLSRFVGAVGNRPSPAAM